MVSDVYVGSVLFGVCASLSSKAIFSAAVSGATDAPQPRWGEDSGYIVLPLLIIATTCYYHTERMLSIASLSHSVTAGWKPAKSYTDHQANIPWCDMIFCSVYLQFSL